VTEWRIAPSSFITKRSAEELKLLLHMRLPQLVPFLISRQAAMAAIGTTLRSPRRTI
jgi:hypothetical protein